MINTKYEVKIRGPLPNRSGILPSTSYVIGKPMMVSSVDPDTREETFAVANAAWVGNLVRGSGVDNVIANCFPTPPICRTSDTSPTGTPIAGLTATEILFGTNAWDKTPYVPGQSGSVHMPEQFEVEGSNYLQTTAVLNDSRVVTPTTVAGTEMTLITGLWAVATSGDIVFATLVKQLTPADTTIETAALSQVRLLLQVVHSYKKA